MPDDDALLQRSAALITKSTRLLEDLHHLSEHSRQLIAQSERARKAAEALLRKTWNRQGSANNGAAEPGQGKPAPPAA